MKFVNRHPFADPDAAARKLVEIANGVEAVQDGRIFIERVNEPFLAAGGWRRAISRRDRARHCTWLVMATRERRLREVHRQLFGDVCLIHE
jgi:hypothetical protein